VKDVGIPELGLLLATANSMRAKVKWDSKMLLLSCKSLSSVGGCFLVRNRSVSRVERMESASADAVPSKLANCKDYLVLYIDLIEEVAQKTR